MTTASKFTRAKAARDAKAVYTFAARNAKDADLAFAFAFRTRTSCSREAARVATDAAAARDAAYAVYEAARDACAAD